MLLLALNLPKRYHLWETLASLVHIFQRKVNSLQKKRCGDKSPTALLRFFFLISTFFLIECNFSTSVASLHEKKSLMHVIPETGFLFQNTDENRSVFSTRVQTQAPLTSKFLLWIYITSLLHVNDENHN